MARAPEVRDVGETDIEACYPLTRQGPLPRQRVAERCERFRAVVRCSGAAEREPQDALLRGRDCRLCSAAKSLYRFARNNRP